MPSLSRKGRRFKKKRHCEKQAQVIALQSWSPRVSTLLAFWGTCVQTLFAVSKFHSQNFHCSWMWVQRIKRNSATLFSTHCVLHKKLAMRRQTSEKGKKGNIHDFACFFVNEDTRHKTIQPHLTQRNRNFCPLSAHRQEKCPVWTMSLECTEITLELSVHDNWQNPRLQWIELLRPIFASISWASDKNLEPCTRVVPQCARHAYGCYWAWNSAAWETVQWMWP